MPSLIPDRWLSCEEFAQLAEIPVRTARHAFKRASIGKPVKRWCVQVRTVEGRGGRSGLRYEVLISSLPEALQRALIGHLEADEDAGYLPELEPLPPKFIAAPNQKTLGRARYYALERIPGTEKGSAERSALVTEGASRLRQSRRTVQRLVDRWEAHGWDLDALERKRPTDAGKARAIVSMQFDKRFRAAGYSEADLDSLGEWLKREIAGWWQSPVQRAGWKRVQLETVTSLRRECRNRGFELAQAAFNLPRTQIERLRFHRVVDVRNYDNKRYDDAKPRIRRNWYGTLPMSCICMDVKPLDCVLFRPDGTKAYPKLIAFMDLATHRLFGRIVLLPQGEGVRQEHVTDAFLEMVQHPDWGFPQQLYCDNGSEYAHFELISEALKMIADPGARVIIKAKPYSGASKPVESKFSVVDRQITALIGGYTGPNRIDKKTHRKGQEAVPYHGSIEEFEEEFFLRLRDFEGWPIGSGPFKGKSPLQVYHEHLDNGWRPVSCDILALDCAFAKQLGERRIDRGAIKIGADRFRHPELAAFTGRSVPVVKPYRRDSWPLANLPGVGWIAIEPEMLHLPGDIAGAKESSRMQKKRNQALRRLKETANPVDHLANIGERVAILSTRATPAPMIDMLMSSEAESFAGARIHAETKRLAAPTAEERRRARVMAETEELEAYIARKRS